MLCDTYVRTLSLLLIQKKEDNLKSYVELLIGWTNAPKQNTEIG